MSILVSAYGAKADLQRMKWAIFERSGFLSAIAWRPQVPRSCSLAV